MMFASSVLHFGAPLAPSASSFLRTEAAVVASVLASPMWAFKPDARANIPKTILRRRSTSLARIAAASSLRLELAHPTHRYTHTSDAYDLQALLIPQALRWTAKLPLAHILDALLCAVDLPMAVRMQARPQPLTQRFPHEPGIRFDCGSPTGSLT